MKHLVATALVFAFVHSVHAGLIVQPSAGTTIAPGVTADFDLIIKNETLNGAAGAAGVTWTDINAVAPIRFLDPVPTLAGQTLPMYQGGINGFNAAPGWNVFFDFMSAEIFLSTSPKFDLAPEDEFLLGTLSIAIPGDFQGAFDIHLDETILLLDGATDATRGGTPAETWFGDSNPPFGVNDPSPPPGGSPEPLARITVTAVPEPSAFLFLGLVGVLVGAVRYRNARS